MKILVKVSSAVLTASLVLAASACSFSVDGAATPAPTGTSTSAAPVTGPTATSTSAAPTAGPTATSTVAEPTTGPTGTSAPAASPDLTDPRAVAAVLTPPGATDVSSGRTTSQTSCQPGCGARTLTLSVTLTQDETSSFYRNALSTLDAIGDPSSSGGDGWEAAAGNRYYTGTYPGGWITIHYSGLALGDLGGSRDIDITY